jgi:hypothetical protein
MSKAQALIELFESGLGNYNPLVRTWDQLTDAEQEELCRASFKKQRKEKGDMFATAKEMKGLMSEPLGSGLDKEVEQDYTKKRNLILKMKRNGKEIKDSGLLDMINKYQRKKK